MGREERGEGRERKRIQRKQRIGRKRREGGGGEGVRGNGLCIKVGEREGREGREERKERGRGGGKERGRRFYIILSVCMTDWRRGERGEEERGG